MTIEEEFTKWFEDDANAGLVYFKLDVHGAPSSTTADEIKAEILKCEKMIEAGEVEPFPPEQITKCSQGAE